MRAQVTQRRTKAGKRVQDAPAGASRQYSQRKAQKFLAESSTAVKSSLPKPEQIAQRASEPENHSPLSDFYAHHSYSVAEFHTAPPQTKRQEVLESSRRHAEALPDYKPEKGHDSNQSRRIYREQKQVESGSFSQPVSYRQSESNHFVPPEQKSEFLQIQVKEGQNAIKLESDRPKLYFSKDQLDLQNTEKGFHDAAKKFPEKIHTDTADVSGLKIKEKQGKLQFKDSIPISCLHTDDAKIKPSAKVYRRSASAYQSEKLAAVVQAPKPHTGRLQFDADLPAEPNTVSKATKNKKTNADSALNQRKWKGRPKGKSHLRFSAEETVNQFKAGALGASAVGSAAIHHKISENEQDNSAVQAVHQAELTGETAVRTVHHLRTSSANKSAAKSRSSRLKFFRTSNSTSRNANKAAQKQFIKHSQQKKRTVAAYQATYSGIEKVGTGVKSLFSRAWGLVAEKKHTVAVVLSLLLVIVMMLTMFASCGTMITTAVDAFLETTWLSEDKDINQADLYYTKLEAELQRKLNRIESTHPGYDEYRYELDDIGHDPVELISYLSAGAENGIFVYDSVLRDELDDLFEQQYELDIEISTETTTTTRTVRVGESIGNVVTSAYCSCSICCGQWAGGPTASGVYPTANHTLAVDAYNPIVPLGTKIVMNGVLYTVEDTGNLNQYGVNFDVYMNSHASALIWGHKTFEAYLYDANGSSSVTVTETSTQKICTVKLKKRSFDTIARRNLNLIQQEQYSLYKESCGNRQFLSAPSIYNWKNKVDGLYGYHCSSSNAISIHRGLDLSLRAGSVVFAGFDGTVTKVSSNSTLGTYVTIKNDKYTITYGHLGSVSVSVGQSVLAGDRIGKAGSTGNVSKPTLHIEFMYDDEYYNPYFYLQTGTY